MRLKVLVFSVLAASFVSPVVAQQAANPVARAEQCAESVQACRSECRARIFAVDPRREVCVKDCAETGLKCTQGVDSGAKLAPSVQSNRSR
jgi:hypothetical protein